MEFTGEFETHITVTFSDNARIDELRRWGAEHGLKCLHILLSHGNQASQPMLTRRSCGTLPEQLQAATTLCDDLASDGFVVARLKIEASPANDDVPQTDRQAQQCSSNQYFEHHVKLRCRDAELETLRLLGTVHQAHLSRNALRSCSPDWSERFLTQRCFGVGLETATQQIQALVAELASLNVEVLEVENEFVVYDSNLAIDSGWAEIHEVIR